VLGIWGSLVQDSDELPDRLILQMAVVVAGVVRRENQREISIGLQEDCRWRDVIAILLIAVLKRYAAQVAERQPLSGPYSLLSPQFDRHDAPY
jgi:hypothetical protein